LRESPVLPAQQAWQVLTPRSAREPARGGRPPPRTRLWRPMKAIAALRRPFLDLSVQHFLGERDAFVFKQLKVRLHSAVQREADLPRPGVHLRILDSRFVHQMIRADQCEPLDNMQHVAVIIARAVEPRFLTLPGDVYD